MAKYDFDWVRGIFGPWGLLDQMVVIIFAIGLLTGLGIAGLAWWLC